MTKHEKHRRARQRAADLARNGSMTVAEWCEHRRLSRSMAYSLWAEGRGPVTHYIGTKRLISREADAAWLLAREAESARATEAA
jgi:hypothetical protein